MSYNKILVAVDIHDSTDYIISKAEELSGKFKSEIILLYLEDVQNDPRNRSDEVATDLKEFNILIERLQDKGFTSEGVFIENTSAKSIVETAEDKNCDLIIIGKHHRSKLSTLFFEDKSDVIKELCKLPILVIPVD